MGRHRITLIMPTGKVSFDCDEDEYLLDEAEEHVEELPWGCRSGNCTSCVGRIASGEVDQDEQSGLSDEQVAQGYVCLCVAEPRSELVIETHKHDEVS